MNVKLDKNKFTTNKNFTSFKNKNNLKKQRKIS